MPGTHAGSHRSTSGRFDHERAQRIRAEALSEVQRLGLGMPPDLDQRLVGLLDLLARHARAVSLRELVGRRRRAYAAASGRYGILGVIEGDEMSIAPVSGDHLADELLRLLPPLPAAPAVLFPCHRTPSRPP